MLGGTAAQTPTNCLRVLIGALTALVATIVGQKGVEVWFPTLAKEAMATLAFFCFRFSSGSVGSLRCKNAGLWIERSLVDRTLCIESDALA